MSQLLLWLNNMDNKVFEKFEIRFNKKKKVRFLYCRKSLSYFLRICTSCCTAIPHDSRVNATGNIPLVSVVRSPEISAPFAYIASTTGRIARIMTILYFAILDLPCCFCTCVAICFHKLEISQVFRMDLTF